MSHDMGIQLHKLKASIAKEPEDTSNTKIKELEIFPCRRKWLHFLVLLPVIVSIVLILTVGMLYIFVLHSLDIFDAQTHC